MRVNFISTLLDRKEKESVRGNRIERTVRYLLYLHGSDVAFAVLELDEQREPEVGRALVHTECYVLPAVLAGRPGIRVVMHTGKRHCTGQFQKENETGKITASAS